MLNSRKAAPACVYLLADHLDGVLAAGEDLVNAGALWPDGSAFEPATAGAQRWAITRLRTHEMSIVTHILQARSSAKELSKIAHMFKSSAHLFYSALHDLEDMADENERDSELALDAGTDNVSFLRERGLIAADVAGTLPYGPLVIKDSYLLAGKMPLGIILDLASEFLDALDIQYDLYPDASGLDGSDDSIGHAA